MKLFLALLAVYGVAGLGVFFLARLRAAGFHAAHPPAGAFVEVDGCAIHVLDIGPREAVSAPVLLIHGAGANLRDMHLALGERLAETRRVLIVDRPGRGHSNRPDAGWRLDVQARLIRGAVDALGAGEPIVIGQSLGGAVALNYALQFQDEMTALILLAPVSHEWPGGVAWYNSLAAWPVIGPFFRHVVLPLYGPRRARKGVADTFSPNPPPTDYFERSATALLFRPHDFAANAADLRNLKDEVRRMQDRYADIRVPTTILADAGDATVSTEIHARRLAEEIPGARLIVKNGRGHALHHTAADEVIALIAALDARRTGAPSPASA